MVGREIIIGSEVFAKNRDQIETAYQNAFSGHPWYENLSVQEVRKRLDKDQSRSGFNAFIAENTDGCVLGGLWYDTPTIDELRITRGESLADFATNIFKEEAIQSFVWERELIVDPQFQRQHIATDLRENFLDHLKDRYPQGVLILTRMKEDNLATIKIAQNLGYSPTGIKIESSTFPGQYHQYWYKIIKHH